MRSVPRRSIIAAGVLALTLGAAACSSSSSAGNQTLSSGVNKAAAALVPAAIKSKGTLTVAQDASYAPNEFFDTDGTTIIGMDSDLAKGIGQELGLKVTLTNETFDGIIPGIQSGRYDVGLSSFTDTREREKVVDFVDYFRAGTSFFTKSTGGPSITGLSSLCGLKVAAEKGSTQVTDSQAQSKKCTNAGKPGVTVDSYNDQNGANLALQSGHDNVGMADSPVAAYAVKKSNGQFKLVGTPYGLAPYGIALPKGNGMAKAVSAALAAMIADGTYTKILGKWGVQGGAITKPAINGAIS
jgi:polar amino acid transport system substrate-binding protein